MVLLYSEICLIAEAGDLMEQRRVELNGKSYPPKRILVCGPRKWPRELSFWVFMVVGGLKKKYGDDIVIIEGEAPGVDTFAREAAEALGLEVDPYPANWKFGKSAGPIRNTQMLDEGKPDRVTAIGYGSGTNNMVNQSRERGVFIEWRYKEVSWLES